ncbi:MAG: SRPBCC family protein [Myxococcota bacterium]
MLLVLLATLSCSSGAGAGKLDMKRVEAGEVYVERVDLPGGRLMYRGIAVLDAPPDRVFNVFHDVEHWPEWHTQVRELRVLRRDQDTVDAEVRFNKLLGQSVGPATQRVRFDRPRGEVAMHIYENEWARSVESLIKLEPFGDGTRTLLNAYTHGEFKAWWSRVATQAMQQRVLTEMVANVRAASLLPRYQTATDVTAAPSAPPLKVVVPGFRSSSVPADVLQTLTRVFAQHLMRQAAWNVLTEEEMVALLDYAKQRELAGCAPNEPCAVDLARALQAERVVHGTVGKVGEVYVFTAALLKLPEGVAEKRVEEQAASDAELLQRVREAASRLAAP